MRGGLFWTVAIFFLLMAIFAKAQDKFEKKQLVLNTDTLRYNILKPANYTHKNNKKFPLIVFLHGAGERGTDNSKQIIHIQKLFLDNDNRNNYPAFVIAPQCPQNKRWVEVDWSSSSHKLPEAPSQTIINTSKLINEICEKYNIDSLKIYITGVSMGGYGTWDMICRYPEKFAAAVPICGGGDEEFAIRLIKTPIWAFHGSNDKVVPVSRSRNMINAIKEAGGHPKYTEYIGVGHGSWVRAYKEPNLLEWLFKQKKI